MRLRYIARLLPVLILAVLLMACSHKTQKLPEVLGADTSAVSRIDVQADWGSHNSITEQAKINSIFKFFAGYSYRQVSAPPPSVGYLVHLRIYNGKEKISDILVTDPLNINGRYYKTTVKLDSNRLLQIVGIKAPGAA